MITANSSTHVDTFRLQYFLMFIFAKYCYSMLCKKPVFAQKNKRVKLHKEYQIKFSSGDLKSENDNCEFN